MKRMDGGFFAFSVLTEARIGGVLVLLGRWGYSKARGYRWVGPWSISGSPWKAFGRALVGPWGGATGC